jgi:hypothetical protein
VADDPLRWGPALSLDVLQKTVTPNQRPALTLIATIIIGAGLVVLGLGMLDERIAKVAALTTAGHVTASALEHQRTDARLNALEHAQRDQGKKLDALIEKVGDVAGDVKVIRASLPRKRE